MDHDRLFKELLTTFFRESLDLFFPQLTAEIDPNAEIVLLDKEVFINVTHGEMHEVDVLARVRFRNEDAYFLVHVENQATAQADFPQRMFRYFARLTEKHNMPVYPVVVFSYDTPLHREPKRYTLALARKTLLGFEYSVIQLNRLPWRRFLTQENPVASALMAKMKMRVEDRPRVKAACLRLLASLKLDPARTKLIGGFVDSYLQLSAAELKKYECAVAQFAPAEREATMEIMTSWHLAGRTEGKETLVLRLLRRRAASVPEASLARLDGLSAEQLDDLGEALLDFSTPDDLAQWLAQH